MLARPTRRTLLATSVTLTAGVMAGFALSARGVRGQATPAASPAAARGPQPDGTWAWLDSLGIEIVLPATPTTIVAQTTSAAALWAFGIQVAGIFGPSVNPDGEPDPQTGDIDLNAVTVVGDYPEIDREAVAALGAELYVDLDRGTNGPWYLDTDGAAALSEQVPILLINAHARPYPATIADFAALAAALGVDVNTPELNAAREDLAAAEDELQAALAANPGLRVLAIAGDPSAGLYVINPKVIGDMQYFRDRGVDVFQPAAADLSPDGNFAALSWEQLGTIPADIILWDRRQFATLDDLLAYSEPIWDTLPAVEAGQIGFWEGTIPYTYHDLARATRELTALITSAERVAPE